MLSPDSKEAACSAGPHPAAASRSSRGGRRGWIWLGKAVGVGGGTVFVSSAIPFKRVFLSSLKSGDIGWRVLHCVYESESACVRFCHDKRIILFLFMENSVRTHAPLGSPRAVRRGL